MVLLGGKERTRAGFAALFEAADLTLADTVCTPHLVQPVDRAPGNS